MAIVAVALVTALVTPLGGQAAPGEAPASWQGPNDVSYRSAEGRRAPTVADKVVGEAAPSEPASAGPRTATPSLSCPAICLGATFATMQGVFTPGSPTGAAGDGHVLAAVNKSAAIYSRAGVQEVAPLALADLAASPLQTVFDPKVVYDHYADVYVLVFIGVDFTTEESEIYVVAIPDATATDDATWCAREVPSDQSPGNGKQWADYPGLGYTQGDVFVSTNLFNFGPGGEGSQVIAFDKAGLYDCLQPLTSTVFTTDDLRTPAGKKIWTLQPATTQGAAGDPGYALSAQYDCFDGVCGGDRLVIARFGGGGVQIERIPVEPYKAPVATQKGAPLSDPRAYWDAGDLRFTNAFYDSDTDRLYAAHAVKMNVKERDGWVESVARWYEVDPDLPLDDSILKRVGNVSESKKDAGWPVVATDSDDNVWINYSRASGAKKAKEYLSAWTAIIRPGTTVPAESKLFSAGTAFYAPIANVQRWGKYSAINRDPLDGTRMWFVNQRAASLTSFEQVVSSAVDL